MRRRAGTVGVRGVWHTAACLLCLLATGACLRELFLWYVEPSHHFDSRAAPAPPDYAERRFWAALPVTADEADLVPPGGVDNQADAKVDVFFIHPTSFFMAHSWNSPMDPDTAAYEAVGFLMAQQASAYNGCCKVYAPRYRQATVFSFFTREPSGVQAEDLAYTDVAKAFDYFLRHFNRGRPFVIAGHSQGSIHGLRLLQERIDASPLYERLIAAYLIGARIPDDVFERSFRKVKRCSHRRDLGCVIAWDTHGVGAGPTRNILRFRYAAGVEYGEGKPTLCVNPLSWSTDETPVSKELHSGALPLKYAGDWNLMSGEPAGLKYEELPAVLPEYTEARCVDGRLIIPDREDGVFQPADTDRSYHADEYALFYMNIRANAMERAAVMAR